MKTNLRISIDANHVWIEDAQPNSSKARFGIPLHRVTDADAQELLRGIRKLAFESASMLAKSEIEDIASKFKC